MAKIMGILNATPDSFYEKSRCSTFDAAVQRGIKIVEEGADVIDIGGESTRPGADTVEEKEEIERVISIIQEMKKRYPIPISLDTRKAAVVKAGLECGIDWINDISGFTDPLMREMAASSQVKICLMHMQGTPETMQSNPFYEEGVIEHLICWFDKQIKLLIKDGVKENNIVIDPGIGFGKTVADNLKIIHNLPRLKAMGFPVLLGISRKSFMSKLLNKPASDLLAATLIMNTAALILGKVDYLRVHDVREHVDMVNLINNFQVPL